MVAADSDKTQAQLHHNAVAQQLSTAKQELLDKKQELKNIAHDNRKTGYAPYTTQCLSRPNLINATASDDKFPTKGLIGDKSHIMSANGSHVCHAVLCRATRDALVAKLGKLALQLGDAKLMRRENERERKARDALAQMKSLFPGRQQQTC